MRRFTSRRNFSNILVVNCGSSSIKFQVIDPTTGKARLRGNKDRLSVDNYDSAMKSILDQIFENNIDIAAVGHRWVNGGAVFRQSVLISSNVEQELAELVPLAP